MFFILFLFQILSINHFALSSSLFTKDCSKEKKEYIVTKVFDGDTILINPLTKDNGLSALRQTKIRLLGIDSFEVEQNQYGVKAKDFLTRLVLNKKVCVEIDVQENDVYGRTLGYVFLINQDDKTSSLLFINEELLQNGYALLYDFPPDVKYIQRLKKAQIHARQNMLGLWERDSYIKETPAQWRHKHPFKKQKRKQKAN